MGKEKNAVGMTTVWQVAFTYFGAIVGAGFASGQEILRFFVVFGKNGLLGALASGVFFGWLGRLVLDMAAREKMNGYNDLLCYLFTRRLSVVFDGIIALFLFFSLAIMLVAGGSLWEQLWGLPACLGFLGTLALVYLTLLADLQGVFWLNTALMPGLIVLTLVVAGCSLAGFSFNLVETYHEPFRAALGSLAVMNPLQGDFIGEHWLKAAGLYVSYNFVLGAVILASLGPTAGRGGRTGVFLGGVLLGLMAAVICSALLTREGREITEAIPMLTLANRVHPWIGLAYSVALWGAMVTTALSAGLGLLKRLLPIVTGPRWFCLLLVFLPTLPFVYWSFPQMVAVIYPLMGYLGLGLLLAIFYKTITDTALSFLARMFRTLRR
ncbi:MAG TPA: hypothetical protein PLJ33_05055 [Peptococcaceae bacterium]|jgi:uncharacterized membrane protein YkvI|nr:hypothetical protein [Clostridia bacterium]HOB82041.1 hypothetical protein [Peptococcaceae bacterium]HPZ70871.1 hypothetical protein [Peptococcaceae bacterium]HQD54217.1 hypothetical protein [Peptococcaceae bacterium]